MTAAREVSAGSEARCADAATAAAQVATGENLTRAELLARADRAAKMAKGGKMTAREIADALGMSVNSVWMTLRRRGITAKPAKFGPTYAKPKPPKPKRPSVRDKWMALHAEGLTAVEAARRLGVTRHAAYDATRRYGIKWASSKADTPEQPRPRIRFARPAPVPQDRLARAQRIYLRGGWQTYPDQIGAALAKAPAGVPVIFAVGGADDCVFPKRAAEVVSRKTGARRIKEQVEGGRDPQFAYAIVRGA